ncbi:MAG: WXG100 family type VII secretion target [Anaerolineales bacterium]|nr:WXG100 family type VII secretion target [Anaerolineales bacterium]
MIVSLSIDDAENIVSDMDTQGDCMARIKVNTEELKTKAEDFASAGDAFNRAGEEVLATALSLPSYDGQLSGAARKAAYDLQSQAQEMNTLLVGDAEALRKTANDFDAVDNLTVNTLNQYQETLSSSDGFTPGVSYSSGDSYLGYKFDENNPDSMILCIYGECKRVIITPENEDAIRDFMLAVDGGTVTIPDPMDPTGDSTLEIPVTGYKNAKNAYNNATIAGVGGALVTIGAGLALIFTAGASTPVSIVTAAGGVATSTGAGLVQDQAAADMKQATSNAAAAWNSIFPGENKSGDSYYSIIDQGPGAGQPVYDPPEVPISSETPEPN